MNVDRPRHGQNRPRPVLLDNEGPSRRQSLVVNHGIELLKIGQPVYVWEDRWATSFPATVISVFPDGSQVSVKYFGHKVLRWVKRQDVFTTPGAISLEKGISENKVIECIRNHQEKVAFQEALARFDNASREAEDKMVPPRRVERGEQIPSNLEENLTLDPFTIPSIVVQGESEQESENEKNDGYETQRSTSSESVRVGRRGNKNAQEKKLRVKSSKNFGNSEERRQTAAAIRAVRNKMDIILEQAISELKDHGRKLSADLLFDAATDLMTRARMVEADDFQRKLARLGGCFRSTKDFAKDNKFWRAESHRFGNSFYCTYCKKQFTVFSMDDHVRTHHRLFVKQFLCPVSGCGMHFATTFRLRQHLMQSFVKKPGHKMSARRANRTVAAAERVKVMIPEYAAPVRRKSFTRRAGLHLGLQLGLCYPAGDEYSSSTSERINN